MLPVCEYLKATTRPFITDQIDTVGRSCGRADHRTILSSYAQLGRLRCFLLESTKAVNTPATLRDGAA